MRSITATVDLDASPDRVWDVLTDTAGHATWNPFITRVSGTLAVGEKIHVRIAPPGGKQMSFRPTVTEFRPGHRIAWLGHLGILGLFDGAHSFTLTPLSEVVAPDWSSARTSPACSCGSPADCSTGPPPDSKACTER